MQKKSGNAVITNTLTGDTYHFIGDKFVLSAILTLTQEEIMIAEWMAQELQPKQIAQLLEISEKTFGRKREVLYKKLDVSSPVGVVHKAHLMGII
jgi:DNA-binding CsgD family transcriptional regulator